LQTVTDHPGIS